MNAQVTQETIDHVKRWEGLRLVAYPDPGSKNGHPFTIGFGHTSDDFMRVTKGMRITEAQAEAALRHDLNEAGAAIDRLVTVPLTDNQRGALISFALNVGEGNFGKSTLLKRLNEGKYVAVPGELMKWVYNDGKRMEGLANRRAAEAGLWAKGSFVTGREVAATKPPLTATLAKPESIAAAGGLIASLAGIASGNGPAQWAFAAVLVMAAGFAIWTLAKKARA